MKASEIREMTAESRDEELMALHKEYFNLNMQKATGQLTKPHQFKKVKRSIARLKTIIKESAGSDNE